MKNITKVLTLLLVTIIVTGCQNTEQDIIKSIDYLNEPTYYNVFNTITCRDSNDNTTLELDITNTFDEKTNLSERDISINGEPYSSETIEVTDNQINRYYGYMVPNKDTENSYYLKEWLKESLELNDQNKNKYILLDKNYYINMIKNAKEYRKFNDSYEIIVAKESIQKILNQTTEDFIIEDDEIYIDVTLEKNNLEYTNTSFNSEKYGFCSYSFSFQTEFDEDNLTTIEKPEI